jgi:N-acyl-D-aspartate/D-glutamate deacylase
MQYVYHLHWLESRIFNFKLTHYPKFRRILSYFKRILGYHLVLIREGMWADLVIFDPQNVVERSTYEDPSRYPEGIETVIVNGVIALKDGFLTGSRAGQVLRKS